MYRYVAKKASIIPLIYAVHSSSPTDMMMIIVPTVEESIIFNRFAIYISANGIPITIRILTRNLIKSRSSIITNFIVCHKFLIA